MIVRRWTLARNVLLAFIAFALIGIGVARAAELKVVGGSAVVPIMDVLIPQFERASGHKVVSDFDAAIGAVAKRIEMGERADVVIVSRTQIESLEKGGKVIKGTATNLAKLGVGVFVRQGASKPNITNEEDFKRAMRSAKSIGYNDPAAGAPVSIYLLGLFERLGIASEMAGKAVVFKHRAERFTPVARGEVEIGFNQISEILAAPGVDLVGALPDGIQNYTLFALAVVEGSSQRKAANEFISFILSPASVEVIKAKGFH